MVFYGRMDECGDIVRNVGGMEMFLSSVGGNERTFCRIDGWCGQLSDSFEYEIMVIKQGITRLG